MSNTTGTPGFYRGTTHDQMPFFANKERKMLLSKNWPPEYSKTLELEKVNVAAFKPWIENRITELLGAEDEILTLFCMQQLNEHTDSDGNIRKICPKQLQVNLDGLMMHHAAKFVKELWNLLLSASEHPSGLPPSFIEQKKVDLAKKKEEAERVSAEIKKLQELTNEMRQNPTTKDPEKKNGDKKSSEERNLKRRKESSPTPEPSRRICRNKSSFLKSHVIRNERSNARRNDNRRRDHSPRRRQNQRSLSPRRSYPSYRDRRGDYTKQNRSPFHHSRRSPSSLSSESFTSSQGNNGVREKSLERDPEETKAKLVLPTMRADEYEQERKMKSARKNSQNQIDEFDATIRRKSQEEEEELKGLRMKALRLIKKKDRSDMEHDLFHRTTDTNKVKEDLKIDS
eukprot:GHVP01063595.1.p3 GENE.GHVP01063595.1~~GHVP01063595.1.p3  ORF type:complete len:399 (+),score=86.34 GHVP01063595.1:1865-3061(+)